MNRSTPGLPVHHQLPVFTQTQVHWVGDAIQPSHPLSSPSHPAFSLSQHQGLFKWVSSSDQISRSVVSNSLQPHESQNARPPCPSPTPGVHSDSRLSSQWCHPAISSSVVPFSSCPQSLPASESFPMSQLFTWGGQSTGVSALASFLPNFQFLITLVLWILVLESRILSLRSWYWYKCPHWSEDIRRTPWDMFESVWCQILS